MKRHPSLVPLSHDHHHALVLAQRLNQGRSKAPRADWPEDMEAQKQRTVTFYDQALLPHFEVEERFLFPRAEGSFDGSIQLVEQLRNDHRKIKRIIDDFRIRGAELDALQKLAKLLVSHIRSEEQVLFEQLQQHLTEKQLVELGSQIRESYGSRLS